MGKYQTLEHQVEILDTLAEAVYRGVLHALPASARAWFGDLRDRGLSAAVEASSSRPNSIGLCVSTRGAFISLL